GLEFLDGRQQLRYRGADVRQLDDVGVRQMREATQFSQVVRDALLLGQAVGELGQDARRHRNIAGFDVDPRRFGERPNDRQKGIGRKQRRLVGQRVDDGRLLGAHVVSRVGVGQVESSSALSRGYQYRVGYDATRERGVRVLLPFEVGTWRAVREIGAFSPCRARRAGGRITWCPRPRRTRWQPISLVRYASGRS